jgi:Sortase domain
VRRDEARLPGPRALAGLGIALGLGLAAVVIATTGSAGVPVDPPVPAAVAAPFPPPVPAPFPPSVPAPLAVSAPVLRAAQVRLPTMDVRSDLVDLDVGADGALQPPADPDVAGWFVHSAVPGARGPAVIAGHVDSRAGPAVFYRLDELAPGDRVEVTRSDGRVFAYRVTTVEAHPKSAFPTRAVYGPTPGPELHLITCGGVFDRHSRHYRDNVVVTAIPVA